MQEQLGVAEAGRLFEVTLARSREICTNWMFANLSSPGDETSGAVVQAFAIKSLRNGCQIFLGVPTAVTIGEAPIALAEAPAVQTDRVYNFGS